jgi:hypothetical protein
MYFPKSQIKTGLITNGGFLRVISTQEEYIGPYFETSTLQYYSGKNPQDTPTVELELIPNNSEEYTNLTGKISPNPSEGDPIIDEAYAAPPQNLLGQETTFFTLPDEYINSSGLNFDFSPKIPRAIYPTPTEEDYKFEVIERYFLKKINEPRFIEINKSTYMQYVSQSEEVQYRLYIPFKFTWQISGNDRNKVATTNYNILKIKENRFRLKGLVEFFKDKYDQFYRKVGS